MTIDKLLIPIEKFPSLYNDLLEFKELLSSDSYVGVLVSTLKPRKINYDSVLEELKTGKVNSSLKKNVSILIYASARNDFHEESIYAQTYAKGSFEKSNLKFELVDLAPDVRLTFDRDVLYSLISKYSEV